MKFQVTLSLGTLLVVYGNPVKRSPQSTIVDISHQPAAPYPVMEPSGLSVTIDTAPEYSDYNHELVIPHPIMDPGSEVSITVDTAPDYEFYPDFLEHEAIYKRQADVFPPVVVVKRQADPHEPRPSQSATCNCPPCNVTAGTDPVKNC